MKETKPGTGNKIFSAIKIIAALWLIAGILAFFSGFSNEIDISGANVAVIPIHGVISSASDSGSGYVTSDSIIESLEKADSNPNIRAIILDIDSPGGSGVAADEISQKLKSINKTKVSVIRDIGASAAYWIAVSADKVYANRLSLTGSIGVIGSYLDFSGLLERYNVTYQRYVTGELKDMGSPFKEPSEAERKAMQNLIDKMKYYFVLHVSEERNLSFEEVEKMATGEVYLGIDAMNIRLIDDLGTKQDALEYIEAQMNITAVTVEYAEKTSLLQLLSQLPAASAYKIGKFIYPLPNNFQLV